MLIFWLFNDHANNGACRAQLLPQLAAAVPALAERSAQLEQVPGADDVM